MTLPVTTRVLIFFARNPREVLSAREMEAKFGMPAQSASRAMLELRGKGLIDTQRRGEDDRALLYRIGPALLAEIGGGAVEADAP